MIVKHLFKASATQNTQRIVGMLVVSMFFVLAAVMISLFLHPFNAAQIGSLLPNALALILMLVSVHWLHNQKSLTAQNHMQDMLRSFFDNSPAIMFMRDRNDKLVMTNRAGGIAFGMNPSDMIGQSMSDFREPAANGGPDPVGDEVMNTGKPVIFDIPFPSKQGNRKGLLLAFPVKSEGRTNDMVGGIILDVTDGTKAQRERDELRRLLDAFMRETPISMYLKKATGEMEFVSGNITQRFNVTNEQIRGKYEHDLIPDHTDWGKEAIDLLRQLDTQVLETRKPIALEGVHPGSKRFEVVRRFPIFDEAGNVSHIGGLQVDIDDLMKAREQVTKAQEALHQSEKLAALGQLLAGVSHELNNPLTVVVGRSALLQEKLKHTQHGDSINSLREAANRCSRIVKTFLAMARQSKPSRSTVQINDVLESALDLTAYGLRSAGISLEMALDEDLPEIEADEDQIVQVVTNLIINAQHALEEHEGPRRLTLRTELVAGNDNISIDVADNGSGVDPAFSSRIFEPFFTTKPVNEGTGMGLSMARGIVEEHGGSLTLFETTGGGATFRVNLPIGSPNAERHVGKSGDKARGIEYSPRILIVDDEASIREMLQETLEQTVATCVACDNGEAALAAVFRQPFDLILCDFRMPKLDGIAFYRELLSHHPDQARRVVFLSGDVFKKSSRRHALIADRPVIDKPFDPLEIREFAIKKLAEFGPTKDADT